MVDIENCHISVMPCTNTKDSKEIKQQKVEAILEHVTRNFRVGLVVYRGHFWHICLKYQGIHFRTAVGAV